MALNKASLYGRHKTATISIAQIQEQRLSMSTERLMIRSYEQTYSTKATILSWAPQTSAWLGIKGFSTDQKASSAVSHKEAISPKFREYLAADDEYCCPGWGFRLVTVRRLEPLSIAVAGGRKAKHKTISQNTWLPKRGGSNLPNMYFCCLWRQLWLVKS